MKDRSVLAGSLVAGLLASACCIGPLVLGVLGLGSLGFAAALAPLRPWFLGLTAVLLAIGFYFAYRPQPAEACAPGRACAKPASRTRQRIALWVVTALAVALATYPGWGARLTASRASSAAGQFENAVVVLDVQGMTCTACAGEIERELRQVPGVVRADVSFEQRRAEIALSTVRPKVQPLIAAIEKAGYRATVGDQ
ncbi:MAG: cation transporter [Candidatus Eisenbacteria bacterium]|nr:cation transporter [Candidatus Eisenbacteria bacterium]